ncbi:enoyl-CoA hydratase-related protein [Sphingomonas sp.]|uniref:enoyl-CoA hydratase-related protein n=1 Tax=Sphingomonas sp. TaxID=28214 RepID=UPI003D6CC886
MSVFKYLSVELEESGVAIVRLNRPPANAVDQAMYLEIADLFSNPDQIGDDVRAIVLAAEGPHFCAGNDLDEFVTMSPENGTERMWRVREAFFAIENCPVPVIGAVHGVALGTGLAIAASCDFVVADRNARFGLPELTVGVMGGARHLARIAPQPLVRRMYFTGDHLRAEELADLGGAIFICDRDALLDEARRFALRAASFSPTAVRLAKQILNRIETMDMRAGYEFEQRYTVQMSGHPDSKEALSAFAEKRPPKYLPRSR